MLRIDNGKEYFNTILDSYLLENKILHHSSCNDTSQQNIVVERKNRHSFEVAKALMFTRNALKIYFTDVVLIVVYLIKRMLSKP